MTDILASLLGISFLVAAAVNPYGEDSSTAVCLLGSYEEEEDFSTTFSKTPSGYPFMYSADCNNYRKALLLVTYDDFFDSFLWSSI